MQLGNAQNDQHQTTMRRRDIRARIYLRDLNPASISAIVPRLAKEVASGPRAIYQAGIFVAPRNFQTLRKNFKRLSLPVRPKSFGASSIG